MAHQEQFEFVQEMRKRYPNNFKDSKVLEVGSLDINGSIRIFFENCDYTGLDIGEGKGVDIVCNGEEYDAPDNTFDTVISCECFEHNPMWKETFINMHRMTKSGGLVFFTCATIGRPVHGTVDCDPDSSPFTNQYYRNLSSGDFTQCGLYDMFSDYMFYVNPQSADLYFYGVKK